MIEYRILFFSFFISSNQRRLKAEQKKNESYKIFVSFNEKMNNTLKMIPREFLLFCIFLFNIIFNILMVLLDFFPQACFVKKRVKIFIYQLFRSISSFLSVKTYFWYQVLQDRVICFNTYFTSIIG